MTRLAIWNADSLLGRELKDALAKRKDLWDELRLLSEPSDELLVTDIGDEAALVQPATPETLEGLDLLFFCAESAEKAVIPEVVPADLSTIALAGDAPVPGIRAMVAGVNTGLHDLIDAPARVSSAHPALVALAHLLHPLSDLGLESCIASIVLPSSTRGKEGIDQLLDQTRAILAFQAQPDHTLFGCQLAFNLVPGALDGSTLAAPLRDILGGGELELAIQSSIGGVFHGLALGAHVRLGSGIDRSAVDRALEGSPVVEFSSKPMTLGPVEVAGSDVIRLAPIEPSTAPNSFWLRAVMDNLTLGGGLNALGVGEALLEAKAAGHSGFSM